MSRTALLTTLFPYRPRPEFAAVPAEALAPRYGRWRTAQVVAFLLAAALLSRVWDLALAAVGARFRPAAEAGILVLAPDALSWVIPAVVLGLCTAGIPVWLLMRGLLGARMPEYEHFLGLAGGYDARKPLFAFAAAGLLGAAAIAPFLIDTYAEVTPRAIVVNPMVGLGGEVVHPYDEVAAVTAVSHSRGRRGRLRENPHVVVEFTDGSTWSSLDGLRSPDRQEAAMLAPLIAERAGVDIAYARLDP